jgi:hypothetical protein
MARKSANAKHPTLIRFDDDEKRFLESEAKNRGISQQIIVRECVRKKMKQSKK